MANNTKVDPKQVKVNSIFTLDNTAPIYRGSGLPSFGVNVPTIGNIITGTLYIDQNTGIIYKCLEENEIKSFTTLKFDIMPTLSDLNLDQVDNTSDLDKPISNATQIVLDSLESKIESIESGSLIISSEPNNAIEEKSDGIYVDKNQFIDNPDTLNVYGKKGEEWIVITKDIIGLEFVDNTSDLDKPISTATQAAIDNITIDISLESGNAIVKKNDGLFVPVSIEEAPIDDKQYGRKNGAWTEIDNSGSGGGSAQPLTVQNILLEEGESITLDNSYDESGNIHLYRNGVKQLLDVDYTFSSNTNIDLLFEEFEYPEVIIVEYSEVIA